MESASSAASLSKTAGNSSTTKTGILDLASALRNPSMAIATGTLIACCSIAKPARVVGALLLIRL